MARPDETYECGACGGNLVTCPVQVTATALMDTFRDDEQHELFRDYIRATTKHTLSIIKADVA